jgi:predicted negative regulator of RcsB-dependent stress response
LSDRAQFFLAKVLAGQKETDAALNQLRELSEKTGSDWSERARLQIPQVLMGAGRYEAALAEIDLIQRSQPVGAIQGELELRRCEALVGLKRSDEAEVALKALVARADVSAAVSAQAGYGLGQIAWQRGEFSAALSAWESAQGRGPSPALAPMLLFRSGEALT